MSSIRRGYCDASHGQIHYRVAPATAGRTSAPLVCLHPMPYGGRYFETLMPLVNRHRDVYAPDYPGHGQSDPLPGGPTVEAWATATIEFIDATVAAPAVDLLGFHSGCLVGAEIALRRPELCRRLALIDVPLFDEVRREQFIAKYASRTPPTAELEAQRAAWDADVASRAAIMPLERAIAFFADRVGAAADPVDGFVAAFRYPAAERLAALRALTLVIATGGSLTEATRNAAGLIDGAQLCEVPDVTAQALEVGAPEIAALVDRFLADRTGSMT